jgi:hypothetical protein
MTWQDFRDSDSHELAQPVCSVVKSKIMPRIIMDFTLAGSLPDWQY